MEAQKLNTDTLKEIKEKPDNTNEIKQIIAYPPIDFNRPFEQLKPEEIDIYFHYTNEVWKNTCKANCSHCYLKTKPQFNIPIEIAMEITDSLAKKWYNIWLVPPDTFSDNFLEETAAYTEKKAKNGNEKTTSWSAYRLKEVGKSARSGWKQLTVPGWEDKLTLAYEQGYRSVIITAHDAANTNVPIKWVTQRKDILQAVKNISQRNKDNPEKEKIEALCTFTIGKHNLSLENMRTMAQRCLDNDVSVCRFNCFANFLKDDKVSNLEMSKNDIKEFWRYLTLINEEFYETPLKFWLSEDIGDAFVTQELLPYLWEARQNKGNGRCRAWYRLFAMIEVDGDIVITWCVDAREPIMGRLIMNHENEYDIARDYDQINNLRENLLNGKMYACYWWVGKGREEDAGFWTSVEIEESVFWKDGKNGMLFDLSAQVINNLKLQQQYWHRKLNI